MRGAARQGDTVHASTGEGLCFESTVKCMYVRSYNVDKCAVRDSDFYIHT